MKMKASRPLPEVRDLVQAVASAKGVLGHLMAAVPSLLQEALGMKWEMVDLAQALESGKALLAHLMGAVLSASQIHLKSWQVALLILQVTLRVTHRFGVLVDGGSKMAEEIEDTREMHATAVVVALELTLVLVAYELDFVLPVP